VQIKVLDTKKLLGNAAAAVAADAIRKAIREKGRVRIIVATGASQFEFLDALTATRDIDWSKVEVFHLDEYVGLPANHPASFRKYLMERLIHKTGITHYHFLDPDSDPQKTADSVGKEIAAGPIDVAFVGIGENGHLAFNDPPADFKTSKPYLLVELDEECRQQQVNEGWFADISEVPQKAISMSVRQMMSAEEIICVVPDGRKAQAVRTCIEGPVSPNAPASILQTHPNATIFLDQDSAALLKPEVRASR
jgi:glucosamine-6-phosphate deaminase